eukprot:scaffold2721_cov181-Ochromonas_danica.AAC.11
MLSQGIPSSGLAEWPSGPRRSTQVRISTEAWVRTPLQSQLLLAIRLHPIARFFGFSVSADHY